MYSMPHTTYLEDDVTLVLHSSRDVSAVLLAARQLSSYLLHLPSALTRHTWLS